METIAKILRTLRTERGYTQTEVAAALNLTSQAVSKWENGSGMPDVTQLVPLADFYGVTVDCLLGRKDDAAEREVTEFIEKYNHNTLYPVQLYMEEHGITIKEAFTAVLDEARRLMKKYPNNYRLMDCACCILFFAPKEGGFSEAEGYALNGELAEIAEKILEECTDSKLRNRAIWILSVTYPYQNRYADVKKLAELVPDMYTCREAVMCDAAEWDSKERRMYCELYLKRSMLNVNYELRDYYKDYNTNKFPSDQVLALTEMEWKIIHAYQDHGDFDLWCTFGLFGNRMHAARAALVLGRPDDAARMVEEAIDMLAVSIANDSNVFTSSFMTHTGERTPFVKERDHKEIRKSFAEFAESDAARDFRETDEFAVLCRRLDEILS